MLGIPTTGVKLLLEFLIASKAGIIALNGISRLSMKGGMAADSDFPGLLPAMFSKMINQSNELKLEFFAMVDQAREGLCSQ